MALDGPSGTLTLPKMRSEENQSALASFAILGLIIVLFLAILYPFRQAGKQSLDVWTRAAWIVRNITDEQVFPRRAELCAAPFCTRVDTQPKYVGGNPGHRSETTLPFCPEHTSGLPLTKSRFDDGIRFIYWVLAMALSYLEAAFLLTVAFYPLALIGAFVRRSPKGEGPWERALANSSAFGIGVGGIATLVAWGMFAWW